MRKHSFIAGGIMALAMLSATVAKADAVTLALTSTPSGTFNGLPDFTTVEGSGPCSISGCQSLTLDFTVTNNSGSAQSIGFDGGNSGYGDVVSGDSSDSFLNETSLSACSPNPLPNGASCVVQLFFYTTPVTGPTDHDFGVSSDSLGVQWTPAAGGTSFGTNVDFYLTVYDPGAVPEPSSFLLLSGGLLLLPTLRRLRFLRQ